MPFTDSDFRLGGTNAKGWVIGGNYGLAKNIWFTGRWLSANEITGPPYADRYLTSGHQYPVLRHRMQVNMMKSTAAIGAYFSWVIVRYRSMLPVRAGSAKAVAKLQGMIRDITSERDALKTERDTLKTQLETDTKKLGDDIAKLKQENAASACR